MALVKCDECSSELSTEATACPKCGAKRKKKAGPIAWIVSAAVLFGIVQSALHSGSSSSTAAATESATPASAPKPTWNYSGHPDKMTGKTVKQASTDSLNTHELEFPYQGGTIGHLVVRQHPRYGKDVIFAVNKGQLLCGVSDGCSLMVRFDNNPPVRYHATEPSDHDSTTLFLTPYNKFVKELKAAKHVAIEAQFFQQGNRTFEFKTENLQWE